jgi:nicotinamidase-related amidase
MDSHRGRLLHGPLGAGCAHICVDMQRIFAEETPWKTPWLRRVLPNVIEMAAAKSCKTAFTRFIPANRPGEGPGVWKRYYERWADMTLERIGIEMVELVPELTAFSPPAAIIDKWVYSPWQEPELHAWLRRNLVDTLVITGGETDVCVLATVLGAIDFGYRVVLATDALCSSSDETHDALLTLYENRFSQQVEAVSTEVVLANWHL